jgi:hypothetical protein
MSQHEEDRDKVVNALGGKKGLIDSGVPSVVFLIVFNFTKEVNAAIWAALSLSIVLAIFRLIKKDTIQHSVSGVIGVLICAYFANRSGNATDFYIPKLLTNLGYGTVYLIANLVGWPILGLVLGPLLGENFTWRNNPARKKMYVKASWLWVGMFLPANCGSVSNLQERKCQSLRYGKSCDGLSAIFYYGLCNLACD